MMAQRDSESQGEGEDEEAHFQIVRTRYLTATTVSSYDTVMIIHLSCIQSAYTSPVPVSWKSRYEVCIASCHCRRLSLSSSPSRSACLLSGRSGHLLFSSRNFLTGLFNHLRIRR